MTREAARALCDAGYMHVKEYIRLCEENGWAFRSCSLDPDCLCFTSDYLDCPYLKPE